MCALVAHRPSPITFNATVRLRLILVRAINHPLSAAPNLFEQLVIAKFHFYSARLLRILVLLIKRTEATSE